MAKYFIYKDGEKSGPFSVEELMTKNISQETLVWTEGNETWLPAWKIGELQPVLSQGTQAQPVPPPLPDEILAQQSTQSAISNPPQGEEKKPRKRHRGCLVTSVIVVVIILVLLFTCPSPAKHKEAFANEVNSAVSNVATKDYGILGAIGSMFASGVVSVAVGEFLDVDDYFLFSIGRLSYGGEKTIVSIGILNHVFTLNSDIIEEHLDEISDQLPIN